MEVKGITPILNVSDIGKSFQWFEALGWKRGFSWNQNGLVGEGPESPAENEQGPAGFGSVCTENATIFLACDCQGSRGTIMPKHPGDDQTDGVWMSWWVSTKDDVDRMHDVAIQHDMTVTYPPTDEPWGVREFHLRHPDGHMFRVGCGVD